MTPQLQQAIRLLQLSTLDLELEIQQALDSNFMLEEIDPEADEYSSEEDVAQPDTENRDTPEDGGDEITESIADELLSMDLSFAQAPLNTVHLSLAADASDDALARRQRLFGK